MKILHILDHSIPLHSGYTFRTRAILKQQRKLGWETAHITSIKHNAESPDEEFVDGLQFYRTRSVAGLLGRIPIVNQLDVVSSLAKRLDPVIETERPDILHAHSPCLNGLAALRAGKRHDIPVVYECRAFWEDAAVDHGTSSEGGLRYRLSRAMETRVFHRADAVTTICEGLKREIASRGVPNSKITVIPNAVDTEHFRMNGVQNGILRDALGLENKTVLGFIGSFYAYEGLSLLISAMPGVISQAPHTRLLLVGGGPEEERLRRLADQLQLNETVHFIGRVPHSEVGDYYNLVDILVYPRLRMRLTDLVTPLKPLEAMAQGKLVIASDVGGHKELIIDGKTGRMFSAGNSESLADAALETMRHRERWDDFRTCARRYVEEERNWPASVSHYREVYEKLL